MLTIIAEICTYPGQHHRDAVLALFKEVTPAVLAEPGCFGYASMIDSPTGADFQSVNANSVIMIEQWQDIAALQAHRAAPHMMTFHQQAKKHITDIKVRILESVL